MCGFHKLHRGLRSKKQAGPTATTGASHFAYEQRAVVPCDTVGCVQAAQQQDRLSEASSVAVYKCVHGALRICMSHCTSKKMQTQVPGTPCTLCSPEKCSKIRW